MALVTPNAGELELLDKMLKDALTADENYLLKLYQNNVTPNDNSVTNSFTQANFTSYAARTLTRAGWSSASDSAGKASTAYAQQSWTCGATGNTVYGYYVEAATSGVTLWAERFATSRVLADGDVLNLSLNFTLNKE